MRTLQLRPRPHYAWGIWKRRFHCENESNVFRPHYAGGIKKTQQSPVILDLCLRKTRTGKSRDYREAIVFEKFRFQNAFHPHENEKPAFTNFSGLMSVFQKLRFRDGLVWTEGLTEEIKLGIKIHPPLCGRGLRCSMIRVILDHLSWFRSSQKNWNAPL